MTDADAGAAEPAGAGAAPAMDPKFFLRLIGIGAAIGIPAAVVAAGFLALVNVVEDWLWKDLPEALGQSEPPAYLVIGLPVVGALLVFVARRFLPGDGGHRPLDGIGGASVTWRHGPSVALAAFGTLAFGAVLGPEAPLIMLGSVVGTACMDIFKAKGEAAEKVLSTAGSFSAVSALFGGPLVAGILLLEAGIGAGAALIPALIPGLVAAAVGYVLFVGIGSWGGVSEASLNVPNLPVYNGTHLTDLLLALVVGIVTAILVAIIRRIASQIQDRTQGQLLVGLLLGGLAVGVLAMVARLLGADSQEVLFSGQESLPAEIATTSAGVIIVLVAAKGLAYAVSLGSGFRGGPVFPAIFLGTGVATVATIALGTSPTWAVAVGCAAGMAAGTRLIFSALMLSMMLVGHAGFDAMPAAVFAAAAAWLTMQVLDKRLSPDAPVTTAPGAPAAT